MTELADLTKPYDAKAVEGRTYAFWEQQGYFTPKIDASKQPFTIMIPPPNVTGALHTGHALTLTVEDSAQGLRGWLEYNTDRFDAATIARMVGHWQTLLEGIVAVLGSAWRMRRS